MIDFTDDPPPAIDAPEAPQVQRRTAGTQLARTDRSRTGLWFWEVDRMLLLLALLLMAIGLVAVAAASPVSATRYSGVGHKIAPMYYFWRQFGWVAISTPLMVVVSTFPVALARRLSVIGAGVFLLLLALLPLIGSEVNGSTRWFDFGFAELQPSEFLKPLFIVTIAWMLSFRDKEPELPMLWLTGGLTALVGVLLMIQPDFGQTIVFASVWVILMMVSGISPAAIGGLFGTAVAGVVAAYLFYDTARTRIDNFLFPSKEAAQADRYQIIHARQTITGGGFFGTGPGGGQAKYNLPEAHTDYIFSVVGEEFGLIACIVIAVLYLALVLRVFLKLLDEDDAFKLLAATGLAAQFGIQATINMAVNTGLAPSKGMTLPFISYGGSSMLALSIGMGLLLVFTRRNPYLKRSPYKIGRSGK